VEQTGTWARAGRRADRKTAKRLALPSWRSLAVFALVAAGALAADLLSKHLVFRDFLSTPGLEQKIRQIVADSSAAPLSQQVLHQLDLHRPVGAGLRLTMSVNPGVVFGWNLPRSLVLLATGGTILIVVAMLVSSPSRGGFQLSAIGLIFAGAMGNLYDRLFSSVQLPGLEPIRGYVRDFIDASQLHYPYVFNVADVWLVIGVGLLLIRSLIPCRQRPTPPA